MSGGEPTPIGARTPPTLENGDLLAVLDLGDALSSASGPAEWVALVHTAAARVAGATSACLARLGGTGFELFRSPAAPSEPTRSVALPAAWLSAFPGRALAWPADGDVARAAAALLGGPPSSGMAAWLGSPGRPSGLLSVRAADRAFAAEDLWLIRRMADFVTVALLGTETGHPEGSRALSSRDLLVPLAREKELLDQIVRCIPAGLLLTDADGTIELSNDAAGRVLGLTGVEMRERKIFRSRPAGQMVHGLIQKALAEGKPVLEPFEVEGRWHQIQVVPWPGLLQFLVVTQDIHDWHQLNRLKENLISIISHEVKNPLTAVLNAAHLLASGRAGELNPAQSRLAGLVQENSEQIRGLLDDVVRLSRVYHLDLKKEPVALVPMIRAVQARSAPTLGGKLIRWREAFEEVTVSGEAALLESLLTNLIGNAIKYTGIGGRVGVRLWSEGGRAILRIADDGPGIPAEDRARLFTPFFRASNVRDQVTGTGLGLVIVKNIAERLGGTLSVASPLPPEDAAFLGLPSAPSRGTAFQVELPLARG